MHVAELRFILLIAGLVFLVVLAAWELRKPRQAAPGDPTLRRPTRSEPEYGSYVETTNEPTALAARVRSMTPPPSIDLPEMEAIHAESILADRDALQMFEAQETQAMPVESVPDTALATGASVAAPLDASPPALVVEWPPEGERHIVALRIVSASEERLSGRAVRLAITACGFVHGPFGIFHQPDRGGRALLSVASLSKPGILDPVNMDFQRLAGLNLFTVLPGSLPPAAALDHLIDTARELSQRLPARVQDEQGHALDGERLELLRDRVQTLSSSGFHAEPAA